MLAQPSTDATNPCIILGSCEFLQPILNNHVEPVKNVSDSCNERLFSINPEDWDKEIADSGEFFAKFGDRMPKELIEELHGLKARLKGRG